MTDETLGTLLEAFANFYWSVPVKFVSEKISEWHPEVSAQQFRRVLDRCDENLFRHHCCTVTDGMKEPEIVVEHLIALDDKDLDNFISARIAAPYREYDEETLLRFNGGWPDMPEINAIIEFGKTELGLEDAWATQLVDDCLFLQPSALCEGKSWVMSLLSAEKFGEIQFRTIEQIERFRILGNRLYPVLPNPVLRGWKPNEIENPPVLLDDIPDKEEDIPDERAVMDVFLANCERLGMSNPLYGERVSEHAPKRKIGRNDPCPCGSGKKYKKCCGRLEQ